MKLRALEGLMIALCLLPRPAAGQTPPAPAPAPVPVPAPVAGPAATDPDEAAGVTLMLVALSINGQRRSGEQVLAARRGSTWFLTPEDLDRLKIRHDGAPVRIDGETMVPLPRVIAVSFDSASQQLDLIVPPEVFAAQRMAIANAPPTPTPGTFAAFLNYDLSFDYGDRSTLAGFFETAVSDEWGLVANTMTVGQAAGTANRAVRLDSYYVRDDPDHLTRLIVGDTVTTAPEWARQIRFGGVRFGTEFGLNPNLVTFPTPAFLGRTAVPSNVELLVNDAVRFQSDVDQGPFSINQVPLVTGAGEVTLVTRDALGVERRVRTAYYVSPRLLTKGLSAWSVEAGADRRDYGLRSFSYGTPFAAASYRRGLTDWLTVEGRAEASETVQMGGGGVTMLWPALGEFTLAAAASHGTDGSGGLYRAAFSRITPRWNVSLSYQRASRRFGQLGIDRDSERITRQFQASAGVAPKGWGSLVATWTDLEYGDGERARVGSVNYSASIGGRAYLNLFAIRSHASGLGRQTTAGLGLTLPLGPQTSAYAQADNRNRLAEVRKTAPFAGGWGYRLTAGQGDTDRQQAELQWRGSVGEMRVEAARFEGEEALRLLASGGVLLAGGGVHATRRIESGFGVVEVPGQADVRIFQENRLVARTDSQGTAIIPDLRAYEPNRISLAPSDLPLDVRMASDTMTIVPRLRGAARARFSVERDTPGTILVTLPDGQPAPVGAGVRTDGGETAFVGYGGEIFVQTLRAGMTLDIETAQGRCRAVVRDAPGDETLPRIGPIACAFMPEKTP